jgi:hypothetical protein
VGDPGQSPINIHHRAHFTIQIHSICVACNNRETKRPCRGPYLLVMAATLCESTQESVENLRDARCHPIFQLTRRMHGTFS